MRLNSNTISRIADSILRTAGDDYEYIHDPDHRNRPHGTFWSTGRGWSNDPKHDPKNKRKIVPRGTNLNEQESYNRALKYFDQKALETAKMTSENPKSRERLIFMNPSDFLSVAKPLRNVREDSMEAVKSSAESNQKWSDIPYLYFDHDGKGMADVSGHEGRHRAMYLQSIGEPVMPVKFISSEGDDGSAIRWGEQENPESYDRIDQKWPRVLRQEDGSGIIPFPVEDLRKKKEIVPRRTNPVDRPYFQAVQSGDMDTVKRMVDEKAKQAGYTIKGYHGTNDKFNKVDLNKGAMGSFWFAGDKEQIEAGESGAVGTDIIKELYVRINKPAGWKEYEKYSMLELARDGYDGVILPDNDGTFTGFVWQNPAQVKSADPIIKDDNGKIIPLSKRFNTKSRDLRL